MGIDLLENLLDCLVSQEEALLTRDEKKFEQSCFQLFAIEKQLKSVIEPYIQASEAIDSQTISDIKILKQKIQTQRFKNDLLFKKFEEYLEFLQNLCIQQPSQYFVYSRDLLKKRS